MAKPNARRIRARQPAAASWLRWPGFASIASWGLALSVVACDSASSSNTPAGTSGTGAAAGGASAGAGALGNPAAGPGGAAGTGSNPTGGRGQRGSSERQRRRRRQRLERGRYARQLGLGGERRRRSSAVAPAASHLCARCVLEDGRSARGLDDPRDRDRQRRDRRTEMGGLSALPSTSSAGASSARASYGHRP